MDHIVAKELKDAGFPQVGNGTTSYIIPKDKSVPVGLGDSTYYPTLSELIAAIGALGYVLEMHQYSDKSGWMASVDPRMWKTDKELDVAVARLLIALKEESK